MERLTKKISKTVQDKYSLGSYLQYDFAQADDVNKLLNKLGKFEDFMEEQGFKDLQSLKDTLYQTNMELYSMIKLQKENQSLKDRWQKLKEYITNEFNYDKENIRMVGKDYGYGCINTEEDILAKMQELEKEIKWKN